MATAICTDFPVTSKERWVATPALVMAGRPIQTRATGRWKDAYISCGPEGYWAPFFYLVGRPPRVPDALRYFRLMGCIGAPDAAPTTDVAGAIFVLGQAQVVNPQRSGRLYVFANDRWDRYFNNDGEVALSVEQL